MRFICTSIFIVSAFVLFGQESVPHQFWNNFSHFNPSFAGLQYQQQAGLTYHGFRQGNSQNDYQAFFNQRLKNNIGIGFNGNHMTGWNDQTSEISIPVSYDWNIKGKHHLALGVAPSYRNHVQPGYNLDTTETGAIYITGTDIPFTRNIFQAHTGITYKVGVLTAGLGIRNLHIRSSGDGTGGWEPHYYGHISAEILVGSRSEYNSRHKMILSGLYTYVNGFARIDLNARVQCENGLTLFAGGRIRSSWTQQGLAGTSSRNYAAYTPFPGNEISCLVSIMSHMNLR